MKNIQRKKFYKLINETIKIFTQDEKDIYVCLNSINIINNNSKKQTDIINFLFSKLFILKSIKLFFLNILKIFAIFFLLIINCFFSNNKERQSKILFISHTFNDKIEKDNYFGNFKNVLRKNSNKYSSYFIRHNQFSLKNYKYQNINFFDLIKIFSLMISNFILWIFIPLHKKINIKIYIYCLVNIFSTSSLRNYLIVFDIIKEIKALKINKLYYTFEGHIFERYLFEQVKKNFKNKIFITVYQHTGLSKQSNSIFLMNSKKYKPDKILCINNKDVKLLKRKYSSSKILNIGRYKKKLSLKNWKILKNRKYSNKLNLLILLDDNIKEIKDFIKNPIIFKKVLVTIRCHPEKKHQLKELNLDKSIKISKNNHYISDLRKNDVLVYTHSSLLYEAIRYGLLPIKLKKYKSRLVDTFLTIKNYNEIFLIINNLNKINYEKYLEYSLNNSSYFNEKLCKKIINE